MGLLAEVTPPSVSSALGGVGELLGDTVNIFAGQPILLAMLGCAIAGVGLKLFKRSRRAVQ